VHRILAAALLPVALSGCAAVLVGGLFYHDSKTRDQRLAFTQDFQKQNLEREKASLQPLKWCDELYRFDQSWYAEDANCKAASVEKASAPDKS
jgi:hypothetical protein